MEWHISSFSFNCFLPTPAFLHCHSLKKSSKEKLNAKNWNESADVLRSVCSQWLKEAAAQIKLYLRKNTNGLKSNSEKCSKSIRRRNNFAFGAFVWNTSGVFLTALVYTFICAVEKKNPTGKGTLRSTLFFSRVKVEIVLSDTYGRYVFSLYKQKIYLIHTPMHPLHSLHWEAF